MTRPWRQPAVDLEPNPAFTGYWVVDDQGHVYALGQARGDLGNADLSQDQLDAGERVTSLSATPSGNGYWIFTNRGRVFAKGDAQAFGDLTAIPLNGPVLDSIPTPTGKGYYMVASDGGIFAFGDAAVLRLDGRHPAERAGAVARADGVEQGLLAGGLRRRDLRLRGRRLQGLVGRDAR